MHDDALKQLWRAQSIEPAPLPDSEQLDEVKSRVRRMNRTLFWRDCRENVAAVFIMACFGLYLLIFPNLLARLGSFMVILSALLMIVYPIWRKRRAPKATPEMSLTQSLEAELRRVEVEIALLRTILWWYILPGTVGVVIFSAGLDHSFASTIWYVLFCIALDAFIYWINQIACDKKLVPLKRELQLLLSFDEAVPPPEIPRKYIMTKLILLISCLLLTISIGYVIAKDDATLQAQEYSDPTSQMLEAIRVKHKFPALAAVVVVDGKIIATNAVGFRKRGGTEAVTVNDRFHIGSVTKSMTAMVAAMLVEQGKISWATTIGESFPELGGELHADYRGVTLEQLLSHRGGAPGDAPKLLWMKAWNDSGTPSEQRMNFVKGLLARAPEAKPGTKHIYSNQGYAIAGVMLEKVAGKSWEELMKTMLFEPAGMSSAGFGAPATVGKVDHPWGHTKALIGGLEAVAPGPRADNPAAIGPAGTVHCSLPDLAKYVVIHLVGEEGGSDLLKRATFKKLHTSAGDDYALGWVVLERKWAGGRVLMHNGSNTMFYIVIWMAPDRDCAVIVATNVGVDGAAAGCDEAASQLIDKFFPK
jgi:CubicO group peptidase (beta-lactamase class C family)